MKSNIVSELKPDFKPVVLIKSDEIPSDAEGPESFIGGCSMKYLAKCVVDRVTTYFTIKHSTCSGIASGLGWNMGIDEFSLEFQSCFLAKGVESARNKEKYRKLLENKSSRVRQMFEIGERYYLSHDIARENILKRPVFNNGDVAVFKPLEDVEDEPVSSVIFIVNPLELSLLIQLDGSHRKEISSVITPQASACQAVGCHTFKQSDCDNPKPVLGFIDLAAKKYLKGISDNYLSFSMPWKLFLKLEKISGDSVFQSALWKNLKLLSNNG